MTNKEILQADLLDILFEHRNKLYGAYTLRKTYSRHLGFAVGGALSIVLLFILMSFIKKKDNGNSERNRGDIIKITPLVLPDEKPKEPEQKKEKQRPPTAEVDYQPPKIVEDDKVKVDLPALSDIEDANISDKDIDGDKPTDLANTKTDSSGDGEAVLKEAEKNNEPPLPSREPSFPGGPAAWLKFLQRSLQAPEDIEPGKRIEVYVRFWVDIDGSVSRAEIIKSGGNAFDKEVLRVLKKMPRWEPALQAGRPIAVAYQQPVIFIGEEQ
jgi:periplasmic protein TonB